MMHCWEFNGVVCCIYGLLYDMMLEALWEAMMYDSEFG